MQHAVGDVLWSTGYSVGLMKNWEAMTLQNLTIRFNIRARMNKMLLKSNPVENLVACVCTLHLKAYDHKKIQFEFPVVQPLDEIHGPSQFHGHNPWP